MNINPSYISDKNLVLERNRYLAGTRLGRVVACDLELMRRKGLGSESIELLDHIDEMHFGDYQRIDKELAKKEDRLLGRIGNGVSLIQIQKRYRTEKEEALRIARKNGADQRPDPNAEEGEVDRSVQYADLEAKREALADLEAQIEEAQARLARTKAGGRKATKKKAGRKKASKKARVKVGAAVPEARTEADEIDEEGTDMPDDTDPFAGAS